MENVYALRYCGAPTEKPFPHSERGGEGFVVIADLRVKLCDRGVRARWGAGSGW